MNLNGNNRIAHVFGKYESELLSDWIEEQKKATTLRSNLMKEAELREQSRNFINLIRIATRQGSLEDISSPEWARST